MCKTINQVNTGIDVLSTAKQVRETVHDDEVNGLLSIGFKLVAVTPNNTKNFSKSQPFTYLLIWDGVFVDGVVESDVRRINAGWPFLPFQFRWIYNDDGLTVHSVEMVG